jgi:cytochrome c oxidase subunit 2
MTHSLPNLILAQATDFTIFPEKASAFATPYDYLYYFLTAVTAVFTVIIFGLIFLFCLRYRRKENDQPTPTFESTRLEIFYTVVPFIITMVMFFWGATLYFHVYADPVDPLNIHVIGKQWMWKIQHMEGRREINELHVPVGSKVQLTMGSQDVIHSFFIPAFRVKQDVVPGRYTTMSFEPTRVGTYHLFCAEYCGAQHSGMVGRVIVMKADDYKQWLSGSDVGDLPPAENGQRLFTSKGCITCHAIQAPTMAGLYGRQQEVVLQNGQVARVTVDEEYLHESIMDSTAKVVKGYQPIMPSFRGQLTEEEVSDLVAYIRSLRTAKQGPGGDEIPQTQPATGSNVGGEAATPGVKPGVGPGLNRSPSN